MGKTRAAKQGNGSAWQAKDKNGVLLRDVWRYCYSWTDKAGAQHRENGTYRGTKKGALDTVAALKRSHDAGLNTEGRNITFGKFAAEWQAAREESGELANRTLEESKRYAEYLSRFIGDMLLTDITAETVEKLYRDIRRDKTKPDGTTISNGTLLKYHVYLKQIMRRACDYDYIMRNPCDKVKAPKAAEAQRRALSRQDARRLLAALDECAEAERHAFDEKELRQTEWGADGDRRQIRGLSGMSNLVAVRLALATGMRLGEILGLPWDAVNLAEGCITVRQSLTNRCEIKEPKTQAGKRTIWLDRDTISAISEWRALQAAQLCKIGAHAKGAKLDGKPVICSDAGTWTNPSNFESWWGRWRTEHGFRGLKFHELRHTQATQLLANGVDVKTVQTRLGHADPALTLKWYAHSTDENDRRAGALMGGILAAPRSKGTA